MKSFIPVLLLILLNTNLLAVGTEQQIHLHSSLENEIETSSNSGGFQSSESEAQNSPIYTVLLYEFVKNYNQYVSQKNDSTGQVSQTSVLPQPEPQGTTRIINDPASVTNIFPPHFSQSETNGPTSVSPVNPATEIGQIFNASTVVSEGSSSSTSTKDLAALFNSYIEDITATNIRTHTLGRNSIDYNTLSEYVVRGTISNSAFFSDSGSRIVTIQPTRSFGTQPSFDQLASQYLSDYSNSFTGSTAQQSSTNGNFGGFRPSQLGQEFPPYATGLGDNFGIHATVNGQPFTQYLTEFDNNFGIQPTVYSQPFTQYLTEFDNNFGIHATVHGQPFTQYLTEFDNNFGIQPPVLGEPIPQYLTEFDHFGIQPTVPSHPFPQYLTQFDNNFGVHDTVSNSDHGQQIPLHLTPVDTRTVPVHPTVFSRPVGQNLNEYNDHFSFEPTVLNHQNEEYTRVF